MSEEDTRLHARSFSEDESSDDDVNYIRRRRREKDQQQDHYSAEATDRKRKRDASSSPEEDKHSPIIPRSPRDYSPDRYGPVYKYRQDYGDRGRKGSKQKSRGRGQRGRGYGGYRDRGPPEKKRFRGESPRIDIEKDPEEYIKHMIPKTGDGNLENIENNLIRFSQQLVDHLEKFSDLIKRNLIDAIMELPTKTGLYAAIVALINQQQNEFGKHFLNVIRELFITAVNQMDIIRMKILLRFLNGLMSLSVVSVEDIMAIYETLVEQACIDINISHLSTDSNEDIDKSQLAGQGKTKLNSFFVKDSLIYVVIASLPWGVQYMINHGQERFDQLLRRIDNYVKRYYNIEKHNTLCVVFPKNTNKPQHIVPVSWSQFYSNQGYKNGTRAIVPQFDFFEDLEKQPKKHQFSVTHNELFPLQEVPSVYLRIYKGGLGLYGDLLDKAWQNDKDRKQRKLRPYDQLVVEEYISDMLYTFNASYKVLVKHLYDIPLSLMSQTLVHEDELIEKEGAPQIDQDDLTEQGDIIFDYILVDLLLGHMFLTPTSPFKQHYYTATLIEICREQIRDLKVQKNDLQLLLFSPTKRVEIVEHFVQALFDNIESMDLEAAMARLPVYVSHHMANFQYQWNWGKWVSAIDTDRKKYFIMQLLDRIMRLSSLEQVKSSLQNGVKPTESDKDALNALDAFEPYLPKHAIANNKYAESESVKELYSILANKTNEAAIKLHKYVIDKSDTIDKKKLLEQIIHTILHYSGKSYHLLQSYLTMFMNTLLLLMKEKAQEAIIEDIDMQEGTKSEKNILSETSVEHVLTEVSVIKAVLEYWENSPQNAVLTIEKLLHHRELLRAQTLICYLFAHNTAKVDYKMWEIINTSIEYLIARAVRAYRMIKSDEFMECLDEINETLFLLLKKFVHVLLNHNDDESFEYQYILDKFKETIRKWQRYIPHIENFMDRLLDGYMKTILSSPQLAQIAEIYNESRYYRSVNSNMLRGLNNRPIPFEQVSNEAMSERHETDDKSTTIRTEDNVYELIVHELYLREKETGLATRILSNETVYLKVDFVSN